MRFDITHKTILITGANRGIGKALVERFMAHGVAKIYAAVRSPESAAPLVAVHGDKVVPIQLDLTDAASILAAAKVATDVDVVVNNAGVLTVSSPLADDAISSLEYEMEVNVYGLMRMAKAFAPVLKANGGGVFAQLNSVASLRSFAAFSTYCASKAAAYSMTQSLREQLAEQGTYVLSVHPGPIATDMGEVAGFMDIAEPPAIVADAMIAALNAGRMHVFPDALAKSVGDVYQGFATRVIEADKAEE